MGALSLRRASLLFADRSARASRLPLSSPCLSSSPLLNKGNGLLVLHPTDTPNSRHPQDPAGFQLSAFPGYPAKGRPPANNARKPTCLHSLPQEHLPCFGFRRRHGAHELPVPAAQPHAVGRCSAPHSRGGWVLAPPPLPPFSCLCPPHPPSTANFSALLPTDAAAGGTDGALGDTPAWVLSWLPTCIISPASLLRTDAIRTQLTRGGGGCCKKK